MQHFKEVGEIPYEQGMSWKHRFRIDIPDELPSEVRDDIMKTFDQKVVDWFAENPDASLDEVQQLSNATGEMLLEKMQDYVAETKGISRAECAAIDDPFGAREPEKENIAEMENS